MVGKGLMEKKLKREISELDEIFGFIDDFFAQRNLEDAGVFAVRLTIEELFTNLVRHNKGGGEHILLNLDITNKTIVMSLTDFDVEPFDITQADPVDVSVPLAERTPGGLGLHLVKSYVDDLEYEYTDRTMRIIATKRLEEKDV
jgi:anti-sigma regulatory factor (Ser/Thr protein kinase)